MASDTASFGHRFAPPFDLVYLDAYKSEYQRYYDLLLDKHMLPVGGLLVVDTHPDPDPISNPNPDPDSDSALASPIQVDNVLWKGLVYSPDEASADIMKSKTRRRYKKIARELDAFNKRVAADPRVQQVVLPIGDGVSIVRRIK